MLTLLRRIALSLLAFVVLVSLALVAAWWLIDPNDHRSTINRHASEALGHPIALHGDIELRLLPRPVLAFESATIANVDGYADAPFAQVSGTSVRIRPLPLFAGKLELELVDVEAITIRPERNAEGEDNWGPILDAITAGDEDPPVVFSGIADTRINTMAVDYTDHQMGTRHRFTAEDIELTQFGAGSSGSLEGTWEAQGAPFNRVNGELAVQFELDDALLPRSAEITSNPLEWTPDPDRPDALPVDVSLHVEFDPDEGTLTLSDLKVSGDELEAALTLDGVWRGGDPEVSGTFSVTDTALRDRLHTLTGGDPDAEDPSALQRLHAEGAVRWSEQRLRIDAMRLELDDSTLEASIDGRFGTNPLWEFEAALDGIDADRYTPEEFDPDTVRAVTRFILDSATGIGLDGTINVGALETNELVFEAIEARIRSQGDELTILPLEASVYGGSYYGTFSVPLNGAPYTIWFDQRIDALALEEPLTTLFDWAAIEANVDTHWSGSFTGMHWPDIRDSLDAEGTLVLSDGRINRFSLTRMIEDTVPSALGGVDQAPFTRDATTPFERISGELVAEDSTLRNSDARAESEHFSVGGSGELDLADLVLDYQLELTIIDAFETESEELLEWLHGVTIPLNLYGPLADLELDLDVAKALGGEAADEENDDDNGDE